MRRGSLALFGCALVLVSVLLAGCGPVTRSGGGPPSTCATPTSGGATSGGGVGSGGTVIATPNGTVIVLPMTPGVTPNPGSNVPVPPYVTPGAAGATGKVSVTVDHMLSTPCDTIQVAIANGLDVPIYTTDYQSECSIVTLQFQSGSVWQPLAPCAEGRPTMIIKIPASAVAIVRLGPTNGARFGSGPWRVGTYRVAFGYSNAANYGGLSTIYSSPFQIGPFS